jgi:murein L,D-transpeptidase YcbB/YkuD
MVRRFLLVCTALLGSALPAAAAPSDLRDSLRATLESPGTLVVEGRRLDRDVLAGFYADRAYFPVWIEDGVLSTRATAIVARLAQAADDGLDSRDYHVDQLTALLAGDEAAANAGLELLLTAAVMRFGGDLDFGRLDPHHIDPSFDVDRRRSDPAAMPVAAMLVPDAVAYLDGLAPQASDYRRLRGLLAQYRATPGAGDRPAVPDGPSLRPGETSDRVPLLRERLGLASTAAAGDGRTYDAALAAAVAAFQAAAGLNADGIVGRATLAALNAPASGRADKIVATMERMRWRPDDLGERYLKVNIPAFTIDVMDGETLVRRMDVIVGTPDRETPLFSSALTYLEFNPTWTVPPTIASEDILPKVRRDASYLASRDMRVISGGRIRQGAGPGNSLGKVKFMMDNNWAVYLHDTPARSLFAKDIRALSSGCVRLADPIWLADYLLAGVANWSPERRERVLGSWTPTTRVDLPAPMPLHIVYETAWVEPDGSAAFREDIYGIDAKVIAALADRAAARDRLASAE